MDRVDLALCQLLLSNSRTPYQEMADRLGLSVNAVHKRVMSLVESGVIRAFTARISLQALNVINVWAYGRSDSPTVDRLHLELSKNDKVYWVSYSGGGFVYIGGYLRDVSQLGEFTSLAKTVGRIEEPEFGIMPTGTGPPAEKLQPLDLAIIRSLHRDARRPVSDVALDVKASARTVQRRLDRMLRERLVELSLDWYPDVSNDIVSLGHAKVSSGRDRNKVGDALWARLMPNVLFNVYFSNMPDRFVSFLWTNSMRELSGLKEKILGENGIESFSVNVLSLGYLFDTWRDKLLFAETTG
ncbi:MAG TPA: AsnC family transcriptional regulator [Conexivisphaerales archaeon]|nr:AsnC family transcriptional regulator [Conexivisphaerales archaeon]